MITVVVLPVPISLCCILRSTYVRYVGDTTLNAGGWCGVSLVLPPPPHQTKKTTRQGSSRPFWRTRASTPPTGTCTPSWWCSPRRSRSSRRRSSGSGRTRLVVVEIQGGGGGGWGDVTSCLQKANTDRINLPHPHGQIFPARVLPSEMLPCDTTLLDYSVAKCYHVKIRCRKSRRPGTPLHRNLQHHALVIRGTL